MKKNIQLALVLFSFFLILSNQLTQVQALSQEIHCYEGCKACNKENSQNSCTLCSEGRGERDKNEAIYNSCPCFNDYEEKLEENCLPTSNSYEAVRILSTIFVVILMVLLVFLAASGHHLLTFIIFDNYQLIGYLRMINTPLTGVMDVILKALSNFNLGILFGRTIDYKERLTLSNGQPSSEYILNVPDQNITSPVKLPLMGYSYSFLYNMMSLIILYIVIGTIISFFVIIQKCKRYNSGLIFLVNQKRYTIIVRLITITVCEVIFNTFLQLQKVSFSNSFNSFSFLLTLITLIGLAVLVFFIIFAINWSIQVHEMVNPKYNTYFDKLKTKNIFNKNLICIQLFIKLLFISFVIVGLSSPQTSLIILLVLYIIYVLTIGITLSLTKFRLYIAYILLCFSVICQIVLMCIYQIFSSDISSNQNLLLVTSWFFTIFLLISLFACTIYAFAEFISVLPTLITYVRQGCRYLTSRDIDNFEDEEEKDFQENSKDVSSNLELSLVERRKIATKTKKQNVNQIFYGGNNNGSQWYDNPLNSKEESEIEVIQQSFQKQINFELNEKQRGSIISSRVSSTNEFDLNNQDL